MKKKRIMIVIACVALLVVMIAGFLSVMGKKPFKDLDAAQIASVSVRLTPPDKTIEFRDSWST